MYVAANGYDRGCFIFRRRVVLAVYIEFCSVLGAVIRLWYYLSTGGVILLGVKTDDRITPSS